MALHLRRALRPLSSAASALRRLPPPPSPGALTPSKSDLSSRTILYPISRPHRMMGFAPFRSSAALSDRRSDPGEGKIDPNEILFEGCDYNHWLITMDFPKDENLTPEEKVETYVQTLAKVVGSREEAMKRMYACSTTTYTGFQAVMTEEMSEKFRGLPGVVFILPDSYIDPVNKEYGGDKYEMGKITPRPPPVLHGRQGRYGDRNRNYDRPRYDRPRVSDPDQGNQSYNYRQGPIQGDGRNYAPQQNYNPMGQPTGMPYDRPGPMQADGSSLGPQQNYNPIGQQSGMQFDRPGPPKGDGRNYIPNQNYNPMAQQGGVPYEQQSHNQGTMSNYAQQNPYPGGQQGGMLYAQQNTVPGHGLNYPPQQRFNPREQPGSPPYGQEGPVNGEARYRTQPSYSSSPGTGSEANPSAERRDYSPYTGGSRDNFNSPYLRNNQGQQ